MGYNSSNGLRATLIFEGYSAIELDNFMETGIESASVDLAELKTTTDNLPVYIVKNNIYKVNLSVLATSSVATQLRTIALISGRFGKSVVKPPLAQLVVTDMYSGITDTYVDGILISITPGLTYGADELQPVKASLAFKNKL